MSFPDDGAKLIPWVVMSLVGMLSILSSVVAILWAAREKAIAGEKTLLEAELARRDAQIEREQAERARERDELQATIKRLGVRIDDLTDARASDARKNARALLHARTGTPKGQAAAGPPEDWEKDASTGVRDLLSITAATTDEILRTFDPYESTPPGRRLPP